MGAGEEPRILDRDVKARIPKNRSFLFLMAGTFLVAAFLLACGASEGPTQESPAATAEPATSPAATREDESTSSAPGEPEPPGDVAPKFTLPSATGESVSLASFAGDKNVVLVFYRGFW